MIVHFEIVLLQRSEASPAVILGSSTALFVAIVLTRVGSEKTWLGENQLVQGGEWDHITVDMANSPTCSAFSTLRFIFD